MYDNIEACPRHALTHGHGKPDCENCGENNCVVCGNVIAGGKTLCENCRWV